MDPRTEYFRQWQITRLLDCEDFDARDWIGAPGYVPGCDGYVLGIGQTDLGDNRYDEKTLGVVFQSVKCAEVAAKFLTTQGISPQAYDQLDDDGKCRIRREIISALPW